METEQLTQSLHQLLRIKSLPVYLEPLWVSQNDGFIPFFFFNHKTVKAQPAKYLHFKVKQSDGQKSHRTWLIQEKLMSHRVQTGCGASGCPTWSNLEHFAIMMSPFVGVWDIYMQDSFLPILLRNKRNINRMRANTDLLVIMVTRQCCYKAVAERKTKTNKKFPFVL